MVDIYIKDWAKSLLGRMGFVKRHASTSAKVSPQAYDELKNSLYLIQNV